MSSRFAPVRACDQYIAAFFPKQKQTIYVLLSLRVAGLTLLYGLPGFMVKKMIFYQIFFRTGCLKLKKLNTRACWPGTAFKRCAIEIFHHTMQIPISEKKNG